MSKTKHSKSGKGWLFYLSIKDRIPDWWDEFNGALVVKGNHQKNKYRDVRSFSKEKFKDKEHQHWFQWMFGSKRTWKREAKISTSNYIVPHIANWDRRRLNGYWETENKDQIRGLTKAIKENVASAQAIRATAPFILQEMMRWVRLHDKIDKLFDGEPFIYGHKPDSKENQRRYSLYMKMHEDVGKLVSNTTKEWMRIHGVDPNNPSEMRDMATLAAATAQSGAYGAVAGMAAGMQLHSIPGMNGQPSGSNVMQLNGQGVVISPDALLLATHLTKHAETFKKPLPIIEAEPVQSKEDKPNGHAKAN